MAKRKYDESTIVVRDKLYIPVESIDAEHAQNLYTHYMYDNKACARCPNKPMRHNFECDQCASFKGAVATCNTTYKNGIEYVGLPLGDKTKFERKVGFDLDEYDIVDLRVREKFDYPIRMKKDFKLRDYQEKAVKEWWNYKHGLIVAPPRSGKTPTLLYLMIKIGFRGILLANQHEFLQQFVDHVEEMTNLPALEKKTGKKLYGFPKSIEDFDTLQIAVCTYQQFISDKNGQARYKRAIKNFGTVAVDECFTYGHLVYTDKGYVALGDIVEGRVRIDKVRSYDHDTGQVVMRKHESVTKKQSRKLCKVRIDGEIYVCTPNHEFYVEGKGYVQAKDLKPGDDVLSP